MTAITPTYNSAASEGHLRPFDVHRDMNPVADLVEICFYDTMDQDGQRYLRQMRDAAKNPTFLSWANAVADQASLPLSGFVWEENGRVIGNLSLIPYRVQGQRMYLIANVAVHPDYRRRGIARALTARAIERARFRHAPSVWLQVREENIPALRLYLSLGFRERARRTSWYSNASSPTTWDLPPEKIAALHQFRIMPRSSEHWPNQQAWLSRLYPPELSWHLHIDKNALRPSLLGSIYQLVSGSHIKSYSILQDNRLLGVASLNLSFLGGDMLWLAIPETPDASLGRTKEWGLQDRAIYALLAYTLRQIGPQRSLSFEFPAHLFDDTIRAAGFSLHQTLIWMEVKF